MKQKTVLAAAYVRKFQFASEEAYQNYVRTLHTDCEELYLAKFNDGSLEVVLATPYNNVPLYENIMVLEA